MQGLELSVVVVATLGVLAFALVRYARDHRPLGPLVRSALGLTLGLLGAFVVLSLNIDLVPDRAEDVLMPVLVIAVTGALIGGSVLRLVRH